VYVLAPDQTITNEAHLHAIVCACDACV